jgi:hypothetical protein
VQPVKVVLGRQLCIDSYCISHHFRVTGIEPVQTVSLLVSGIVGHQPVVAPGGTGSMNVEGVAWLIGRCVPAPDSQSSSPGVYLDSCGVSALYEISQRVKARIGIRGPGVDL